MVIHAQIPQLSEKFTIEEHTRSSVTQSTRRPTTSLRMKSLPRMLLLNPLLTPSLFLLSLYKLLLFPTTASIEDRPITSLKSLTVIIA